MPTLFDSMKSQMGVYEGDEDDIGHSYNFCKVLAIKVHSESEVPVECKQYADVVSLLKRRRSTRAPYIGMSPGDAIDAMRAKDEGHLNSAQIKRRMTTKKNGRFH